MPALRLKHPLPAAALAALITASLPAPAWADHRPGPQVDSMRCGRKLVQVGDEAFQLIEQCGQPDFRQVVQINRFSDVARGGDPRFERAFEASAYVVTEEWVYKQGPGRLVKILTVTGGRLTDIRLSERQ